MGSEMKRHINAQARSGHALGERGVSENFG